LETAVADELTYALITPYSLFKSRTGGIIGRLLAHANLELAQVRMFIFSDEFVDQYIQMICPTNMDAAMREAWQHYLDRNLRVSNSWHYAPRCMVLLFRGPNAVRHLKDEVIGSFTEAPKGDTIRGTFGDFIRDESGKILYFEPAVITAPSAELAREHLKLLAKYSASDGGVLEGRIRYDNPHNIQTSLVLIKPDNFERRSRRPGNIIDVFSLTGLKIVGARLFNMTVAMGEEFYGPLRSLFVTRLKGNVAQELYARLHDAFSFPYTMHDAEVMSDLLAARNATAEFNRIVEYMTGVNPEEVVDPAQKAVASRAKCLALLYEGPDAVDKIRRVLGSTDPTKAEPGTVRSDFGRDLMRNGAHASDSAESALRERRIVGLADGEPYAAHFKDVIEQYVK
jgi:nucleoside diphosphate kinase